MGVVGPYRVSVVRVVSAEWSREVMGWGADLSKMTKCDIISLLEKERSLRTINIQYDYVWKRFTHHPS